METHIKVDKDQNNVNVYLRNEGSWYNKEEQRREIKEKINYNKIASIVEGYNRRGVKRDIDKMIENGEMIYLKDEDLYIILEPQGSWISLEGEFVKQLTRMFNSRTNNIYYWLYRRYHQRKREGRACYFTKGDICEYLGISNQSKNRKMVDECLAHLVAVGLIQYQIIRKGKTFLRKLTYIGTEIKVIDAVITMNTIIENGADGKEEDNTEEVVVASIGYDFEEEKSQLDMIMKHLIETDTSEPVVTRYY